MQRVLSACIDIAAALIFIIPVFAILNKCLFHKASHTFLYVVFSCYLTAVISLVGLPNIHYIRLHLSVNLVPFSDMRYDIKNTLLNILLFIPMGFLLPILWEKCRRFKNTFLVCLCSTAVIEILQIFTFRATDINDIITNTLGGAIGFFMAKTATKNFSKHVCLNTKPYEMYIVFAVSFWIMFFAAPAVSALFY